ncbi:MAG: hypothetical protein AABX29_07690 [Nanoarchaeota archaeon]
MKQSNWIDFVFEDFPCVGEVSRKMVEAATRQAPVYAQGGVRYCSGRISTSIELEERRRYAMRSLLDY